ncbi:MAG: hypothetical protein WCR67_04995 [Bacilli bacterium]
MRKLHIARRDGFLGGKVEVRIISNSFLLGIMKAEEEQKDFEITKSEEVIQAELIGKDGKVFRSNAYFGTNGGKDISLFLTISGTKMILSIK